MKTILITGATSGFGEATAHTFAAEGWRLVLTGRRRERLEKLASQLDTPCHIAAFDIQDRQACTDFIDELPQDFKSIDVLVNNAGLALGVGPAQDANLDDWITMVNTNIVGLITLTRLLLPMMVKNAQGHIVNLGSIAGTYPYPGGNTYCASKAFVNHFSLCLRADLVDKNIRVTNLEPGAAQTEFSNVRLDGDDAKARAVYDGFTPLNAKDIAEAIHWCIHRPAHVNINRMEIMPTAQAPGPLAISKT